MRRFEDNRIKRVEIQTANKPIPVAYVEPKELTNDSTVFIFNGGLGATNDGNLYLNHPFYDKHYFVTYDKLDQGNNKNKPSQFKKKWLIELDHVVNWTKQMFPNRKIYLLGESWGSAIALVYYVNNRDKVTGTVIWNMPTKPIDPDKKKKTFSERFGTAMRQLVAIIFNKPVKLKSTNKDYGTLTRDPLLIRAMNVGQENRQNALLTAAVWRFMRPSRKALLKYGKNSNYNFMYVQSGEDTMIVKKMLPKFSSKLDSKHYTFIPTGYHILSLEPNESNTLYEIVNNFINKKEAN